jgi:hypothetical protein
MNFEKKMCRILCEQVHQRILTIIAGLVIIIHIELNF